MADEKYKRPAPEQPIEVEAKCRDCVFFREHQTWGKPCNKLGMLPSSVPCQRFTLNPNRIADFGLEYIRGIGRALASLPKSVNLDMAAMPILFHERLTALGFRFGESVYIRVGAGNYLNHYMRGVAVSATGDQVFILGLRGFVALVHPDSVMTVEAFVERRRELRKDGMILDPALGRNKAWAHVKIDYTPPDIDGQLFKSMRSKLDRLENRRQEGEDRERDRRNVRVRGTRTRID